jgi:asparagine synthase (glutamine-hydrolysing)
LCSRSSRYQTLYYWHDGADFCFASDLEGILAFDRVLPKLNLRYIKSYLLHNEDFVHPHYSFFESVYKLPAGHMLSLRAGKLGLSSYWNPADAPPVKLGSDEAYFAHLRLLLEEAVSCRLNAYPSAAAHLSSGLDSSTITVLAARTSSERLKTFSWSFPGDLSALKLPYDERTEIEELKDAEGIDVHYTELLEDDIFNAFGDITRTPQIHQNKEDIVSKKACALGIQSVLSGWGGDEGISYYGRAYLSGLLRQGKLKELVTQLHGWSRKDGPGVWYRGLKRAVGLNVPEPLRRSYNRFWSAPESLPNCLSREFRDALDRVEPYPWHYYLIGHGVKADQAALLTRGQITQRTEAWAAQATRYGINYTYPLLDKRVVEFALGVPDHLYFHHGQNRYLFRQATKGILPDSIRLKTLKRDPAHEDHYYALLDAIMQKGLLLEKLLERQSALEVSGVLDTQIVLESIKTCDTFRAYMDHPSGVERALWLAFLNPETSW